MVLAVVGHLAPRVSRFTNAEIEYVAALVVLMLVEADPGDGDGHGAFSGLLSCTNVVTIRPGDELKSTTTLSHRSGSRSRLFRRSPYA
jgi:hypothetical protein